jgi:hypothetical protein
MKKSILMILLLFVTIVFLGCSKEPESYYPLKEGSSWTYQKTVITPKTKKTTKYSCTVNAPRELEGRSVIPIQTTFEDGKKSFTFAVEEKDGIYYYGHQPIGAKEPKIFPAPRYIIKTPLNVGKQWELDSNIYSVAEKYPISLKASIESIEETVVVPAGTFKKCLNIRLEGSKEISYPFVGLIKFTKKANDWFAPGVGWIKGVYVEECTIPDIGKRTAAYELVSFEN